MTWKERERAFYIGAPLAIVPALGFLPAVTFLVVVPKVVHARLIALRESPFIASLLASGLDTWKLPAALEEAIREGNNAQPSKRP